VIVINNGLYPCLPGRPPIDTGRAAETGPDLRGSGVDPFIHTSPATRLNPAILASGGVVGGHASTAAVVVALAAVAVCAAVTGWRRASRSRRRRTDRAASVAGLLWLIVIVAASVFGWLVVRGLVHLVAEVFG
jgi:hypothetical protein